MCISNIARHIYDKDRSLHKNRDLGFFTCCVLSKTSFLLVTVTDGLVDDQQ